MKRCSKCKNKKPHSDFHTNVKRSDGLQTLCITCMRVRNREYYNENKAEHKLRRDKATQTLVDEIRILKEAAPCKDCGNKYPHYVMDFDHVNDDKVGNISRLAHDGRREAVLKEIAKCELVCSNCHRVRTYKRFMGIMV